MLAIEQREQLDDFRSGRLVRAPVGEILEPF
jgi:hypothetical protein